MKKIQKTIVVIALALAIGANAAVPAGRFAFINDASASKDADDVSAIPFQVALITAFDATSKLVHWTYNCDYEGPVIREDRLAALDTSLFGAIKVWGNPKTGIIDSKIVFNCRDEKQKTAGIEHLRDRINESSAEDPLWIIEAGEPDVIGFALEAAEVEKRKYVKVVTHHPHNDLGPHWKLTGNIAALPGMAKDFIVRIPDQNINLKKRENSYAWLEKSKDPRLEFLWKRHKKSTKLGWNPPPGTVDPSDAGMVWYILDGGPDGGGDETPNPAKIGEKLIDWCEENPVKTDQIP